MHTRASLAADLSALGLAAGDMVMVHAAMASVGEILGGPDAMIAALRDIVGPAGTIAAYASCDGTYEDLLDDDGREPDAWREHVPAFDPAASRAVRMNGVLPEFLRTTPGALRSANPGASITAIGARADWLTADHRLDYGFGPGTPLARLVEADARVLMLGAPLDTMTLMHHAEHLADIPDKVVRRYEVKLADGWHWLEEYDTGDPCSPRLPENFIEQIVTAYLATDRGRQGRVGDATSVLVSARDICAFGVEWIERTAGRR
ncbi:aminoglycoside 3-N-acetyltransferase [Sandarakinorhabdus sp. DWP1-3-1]|uniref:aminoglycoside 3-N-acetyltransferase n=1 Tax=Sandarakinorhabdus sp. DWP1-3-1 TaxID=2804627 RepID=UPI003CF362BB